ncbi:MAG: hypothetical protein KGO49_02790 [Gammaproteobacteria bacterium]|nr:hypothetical protein [Gammaproteobacteria bacterium]
MQFLNRQNSLVRALTLSGMMLTASGMSSLVLAANDQSSDSMSNAQLTQMVKELSAQNKMLLEKLNQLEANQLKQTAQVQVQNTQIQQQTQQVQQQAQAVAQVQQDIKSSAAQKQSNDGSSTTVSGYGEIGYNRPTKAPEDSNVDVQRAVIGLNHRFDDKTKMVAEFEWEHAITSSSDKGEAEVEQLWIEREFKPDLRGRAGLFLMPVGLINQNHEPTAYYGVYRPEVDTKIIPSTWREVGIGLSGDTENGFTWDTAFTTSPNLSKWDPTSTEGRDRGPLQATHGEGQFATARDFGGVVALNWRGIPGLMLGGSVVYDSIGQHQPNFLGNHSKLLMLDLHGRYQIDNLDLSGEIIRATISNTADLNASFLASTTPDPTLIPSLFYGGYLQAGYRAWQSGDYVLKPFIRYEILNTAAGFDSLAAKQPDERIWTLGANLEIGEGVVVKADYRKNKLNTMPDPENHFNLGDSLNLGVGFSF